MWPSGVLCVFLVIMFLFNVIYVDSDDIDEAIFGRNAHYTRCGKTIKLDEETRFLFKDPDTRNPPGTWPWMVSMGEDLTESEINLRSTDIWQHFCGGSLVTPLLVLTAAHCPLEVETKIKQGEIFIRAGDDNLQDGNDDTDVQIIEVAGFSIHPDYLKHGFGARYSDLAILTLATPVQLTRQTRTICLPPAASSREQDNNLPLLVSGWGTDRFDQYGKQLYDTHVQVYSEEYCNLTHIGQRKAEAAVPDGFTSDLFCGGDAGGSEGTCHGDSGSPAVFFKPLQKKYVLKGIVSGGLTCGTQIHPNIYVRVSDTNILNWIYDQLGQVLLPSVTSQSVLWLGPGQGTLNLPDMSPVTSNCEITNPDVAVADYSQSQKINGKLYSCDHNKCQKYDEDTKSWTIINGMKLNTERRFAAGTIIANNQWLVTGGYAVVNGKEWIDVDTAEMWSPGQGNWQFSTTYKSPLPVQGHCLVNIQGGVMQIGGYSRPQGGRTNRCFRNKEEVQGLKKGRYAHGCSLHRGQVFIAGGHVNDGDAGDVEVYNIETGRYILKSTRSRARRLCRMGSDKLSISGRYINASSSFVFVS